jgi:hypothetical protein
MLALWLAKVSMMRNGSRETCAATDELVIFFISRQCGSKKVQANLLAVIVVGHSHLVSQGCGQLAGTGCLTDGTCEVAPHVMIGSVIAVGQLEAACIF